MPLWATCVPAAQEVFSEGTLHTGTPWPVKGHEIICLRCGSPGRMIPTASSASQQTSSGCATPVGSKATQPVPPRVVQPPPCSCDRGCRAADSQSLARQCEQRPPGTDDQGRSPCASGDDVAVMLSLANPAHLAGVRVRVPIIIRRGADRSCANGLVRALPLLTADVVDDVLLGRASIQSRRAGGVLIMESLLCQGTPVGSKASQPVPPRGSFPSK